MKSAPWEDKCCVDPGFDDVDGLMALITMQIECVGYISPTEYERPFIPGVREWQRGGVIELAAGSLLSPIESKDWEMRQRIPEPPKEADIPLSKEKLAEIKRAKEGQARRMQMLKRQQQETWKRMNS